MKFSDISILRDKCYIDGKWIDNEEKIPVINPSNEEILGYIPCLNEDQINSAINSSYEAQKSWSLLTAKERGKFLLDWMNIILLYKTELSNIISAEQGKNIKEAEAEIEYAASFLGWFAEEAKRIYGSIIPEVRKNQRILVMKQAIGLVASITPWNFPAAMITRKIAPSIAAGCSVILKPSEETPFTALSLIGLAAEISLPPGVINIVTGHAQPIGELFCNDSRIRKISFTGSTNIGIKLASSASHDLKRLSLELGGNAAFIILDDADIDKSVEDLIKAKFRNNGQSCIAPNRIFVHKQIKSIFIEKLLIKMKLLKIGASNDRSLDLGPLINIKSINKIEKLIQDAKNKGAIILTGGKRMDKIGYFYEPTILTQMSSNMYASCNEIFGPVITIFEFDEIEKLISEVNNTKYGLACYLYSNNYSKIWLLGEKIETGMIGFNDFAISNEVIPFGGIKYSGYGREGGKEGIEEYLQTKYISLNL